MTYHANGALATRKDQREVTLSHSYDDAGRRTEQAVTAGTVDGDQQVDYTYTDLGQLDTVTTYSDAGTTETSEVTHAYDGFSQLESQDQDHKPSGGYTSGTPSVAYNRSVSDGNRLASMDYPNGRTVHALYGSAGSISADIHRPLGWAEDNGSGSVGDTIVEHQRMGSGRSVVKDYPDPDIKLDRFGGTSGTYAGLDRFGRITNQQWVDYSGASDADVLHAQHGYDRASNRRYADRQVYKSHAEVYDYDNLHRLTEYNAGEFNGNTSSPAIEDRWKLRHQAWTLDQLGNQLEADLANAEPGFKNEINKANEYTAREVRGNKKVHHIEDPFDDSATESDWESIGSGDSFDINTTTSGRLHVTNVAQDTIGSVTEEEARIILLRGEEFGPLRGKLRVRFPSGASSGQAGLVFGYKGPDDYWLQVIDLDDTVKWYHVVDGDRGSALGSKAFTIDPATNYDIRTWSRGRGDDLIGGHPFNNYAFADGFPSGRVGIYANIDDVQFEYVRTYANELWQPVTPRWQTNQQISILEDVDQTEGREDIYRKGRMIHKGVRASHFETTFSLERADTSKTGIRFGFDGQAKSYATILVLFYDTPTAPLGYNHGSSPANEYSNDSAVPSLNWDDPMWVRITCDGTTVEVRLAATEGGLDTASICYSGDFDIYGGPMGIRTCVRSLVSQVGVDEASG